MSRIEFELPEIPETWSWLKVSDVVEKVPNVKPELEPERSFRYIDISSIDNQAHRVTATKEIMGKDAPSRARRPVRTGDVLLSNVRVNLRNTALLENDFADVCSTGFTVLRANEKILPSYLFRYVLSDHFVKPLEELQTGTQYPATSDRVVFGQPIPIPPIRVQVGLISALDSLDEKLNSARDRLATIPVLLKKFRQSVLAAACSGQLTSDWREANDHEEWRETTLSEVILTKPKNGYSAKPIGYETPWKVLTLTATTSGTFDPTKFKYFDQVIPDDSPFWVCDGDIFFQRGNTIEYVGVPALYRGKNKQFIYPDLMMRVRANSRVLPEFLVLACANEDARQYLRDHATGSQGSMPKINQPTLMSLPLSVPGLNEQAEVVRRVESLFALADSIESRLAEATAQVERTTQAILAKAFRGELSIASQGVEPN